MNSVHPTHPLITAREKSQQGRVGGGCWGEKQVAKSWARFYTDTEEQAA